MILPHEIGIAWFFFVICIAGLAYSLPKALGFKISVSKISAKKKLEHQDYIAPDYAAWDNNSYYRLEDAACLWSEADPNSSNKPAAYSAWLSLLRNDIALGKLRARIPLEVSAKMAFGGVDPSSIPLEILISRNDLIDFAERKGLRPRFLFGEER